MAFEQISLHVTHKKCDPLKLVRGVYDPRTLHFVNSQTIFKEKQYEHSIRAFCLINCHQGAQSKM